MHNDAPVDYDVAIVGGGMVGASLALALRGLSLKVLLVEAVAPDSATHSSFDDRSTALGNGSRQVYETLGIWTKLANDIAPIQRIHVSESGRFGFARLEAEQFALAALGYVVPNRALGRELWAALRAAKHVHIEMPAKLTHVAFEPERVCLTIEGTPGRSDLAREISARLVVAADGASSPVRIAAGIEAENEDYGQTALVTSFAVDGPGDGTAYERFTAEGTLAVLPLPGGRHTLIWASPPETAARLMALEDDAFLRELQRVFGWRLGRVRELGKRGAYPLSLLRAQRSVGVRSVLLGNASQALHPVAGQGFNLGLRDAATLAELLADASGSDVGAPGLLERFETARATDRNGVTRFTDGLIKLFHDRRPGFGVARNLGLLLFDVLPPAKRALSNLSWGFGSNRSRLVRG
ncbi:MAG: 2-octaprenyl-6-methoxyphenyl hydroxylase, partial [Steroidobacteraceae bacterium]